MMQSEPILFVFDVVMWFAMIQYVLVFNEPNAFLWCWRVWCLNVLWHSVAICCFHWACWCDAIWWDVALVLLLWCVAVFCCDVMLSLEGIPMQFECTVLVCRDAMTRRARPTTPNFRFWNFFLHFELIHRTWPWPVLWCCQQLVCVCCLPLSCEQGNQEDMVWRGLRQQFLPNNFKTQCFF